jgi:hypothetical protein
MKKLLADGVPWGSASRTPGNHDGPGYTSSLPVGLNYDITGPAPQEDPTGTPSIHEHDNTTAYVSDAAEEPTPVAVVGGKQKLLLPLRGSGNRMRSIYNDDYGTQA